MQPAHIAHQGIGGAQVQMVGIAQHNLGVDILQIKGGKPALNGPSGGNVHGTPGFAQPRVRL